MTRSEYNHAYYLRNKEKLSQRHKDPARKQYHKEYQAKNRERIRPQVNERSKIYHAKQARQLTDKYINALRKTERRQLASGRIKTLSYEGLTNEQIRARILRKRRWKDAKAAYGI